ncbi:hypothetical protein B0H11DRAFT_2397607 [Mycena galericulata]|nr:hypothetical protein B0H11DRAFT_2397607 [Mycena galericulata]
MHPSSSVAGLIGPHLYNEPSSNRRPGLQDPGCSFSRALSLPGHFYRHTALLPLAIHISTARQERPHSANAEAKEEVKVNEEERREREKRCAPTLDMPWLRPGAEDPRARIAYGTVLRGAFIRARTQNTKRDHLARERREEAELVVEDEGRSLWGGGGDIEFEFAVPTTRSVRARVGRERKAPDDERRHLEHGGEVPLEEEPM